MHRFGLALVIVVTFWLGLLGEARAQHLNEISLGMGAGYTTYGFANEAKVLSEDCVVVMSEGYQYNVDHSQGGLMSFSGLSHGDPSFQFHAFSSVLPPFQGMARRVFRLDDDAALYMGAASWDGGNGHLVVFRNIGDHLASTTVPHLELDHYVWPKGYSEPAVFDPYTAIFPSLGEDRWMGTADDELILMTGLGTPQFATQAFAVGSGLSPHVTMLNPWVAVTSANGPDNIRGSSDDVLVVMEWWNGVFSINTHSLGFPMGAWLDSPRPLRIGPDAMLWPSSTGSGAPLVSGVGAFTLVQGLPHFPYAQDVDSLPEGATNSWGAPHPVVLQDGVFAHLNPGPDLSPNTLDDRLSVVTLIDGVVQVEYHDSNLPLGLNLWPRRPLKMNGRMVTATYGPDAQFGTSDDGLVVISRPQSASPIFTHVPLGTAPVDLHKINDDSLWSVMLEGSVRLVSQIQEPMPVSNPMMAMTPTAVPAVRVNDWTLFNLKKGLLGQGIINDLAQIITFPFSEYVGYGTEGYAGTTPRLRIDGKPIRGTWCTISLEGARPQAPAVLAFSRKKGYLEISNDSTLFLDTSEIVMVLAEPTNVMGVATYMALLPPGPALAGRAYALQGLVLDPEANDGFTLTNGLVLHL